MIFRTWLTFDLPGDAETYVHRIGRSGRAGADGRAITFCAHDERRSLRSIEKTIGKEIPILKHSIQAPPQSERPSAPSGQRKQRPAGPPKRNKRKQAAGSRQARPNTRTNDGAPRSSSKRRRNRGRQAQKAGGVIYLATGLSQGLLQFRHLDSNPLV